MPEFAANAKSNVQIQHTCYFCLTTGMTLYIMIHAPMPGHERFDPVRI